MKMISILLMVLAGCAYPTRKDPYVFQAAEKGKAVVYIYRTMTPVDNGNPEVPQFYVNGNKLGKLALGGYYRAEVTHGEVSVIYKDSFLGAYLWKSGEVKFTALPNQTYFVKFSIETVWRITEFKLVANAIGEQEIKTTMSLVN